jgi:hypothetical protein
MIVNISLICLEGVIVKGSVQVFNCFLELSIFEVSEASLIENPWVSWFAA